MKNKKKLRVGSRESKLAVIQSQIVIDIIKKNCPEYEIELITMKTTGDKILDRTLDKVGGKGLFVKELERALLENEIDIIIHSLKDVPQVVDERIPIIAYTKCEFPYDVLVLPKGVTEIDFSKPIGSASMRRTIQIKKIYPNATVKPIRGNVITRLQKLDNGEYSALILAQAGLSRLCLNDRISRVFSEKEMLPQAGQGVIAVQGRKNENFDFIKFINDKESEIRAKAERAFIKELNGGCSSPIAAFAKLHQDKIEITGLFAEVQNEKVTKFKIDNILGEISLGEKLGVELAKRIKEGFS